MVNKRDITLDTFRGFIMILMALDHSATFVAKHSIGSEVWGYLLPEHPNLLSFFVRWISHLCAPGFAFLVGVGLVFLLKSRLSKGWSVKDIKKFIIKRGLILFLLQAFVYNGAWFFFFKTSNLENTPFPGSGGMPLLAFSILSALGFSMIFWSFFINAKSLIIIGISIIGIVLTQIIVPGSENVNTLYHPIIRLLFIPGQTGIWLVRTPFVPWLSFSGIGIIWGRLLTENKENAYRKLYFWGMCAISGFLLIRLFNSFGNTHKWDGSFISFIHLTKFPPSIAYALITLGINFLIIVLISKVLGKLKFITVLEAYGKSPLFFYLTHIYLYLIIGFFFPKGIHLIDFIPLWIAGLLILYFPCLKYGEYKESLPAESFWKIF